MHAALAIDEILRNVVSDAELTAGDLAAAAETCRSWSDPSLDELWQSLHSLGPLISVLPHDLLTCRFTTRRDQNLLPEVVLEMKRSFIESDWVAFRKYSSRVRTLWGSLDQMLRKTPEGNQTMMMVIAPDLLEALAFPNSPKGLFPKLRKVAWLNANINNAKLLHLLVVPSLTTLHLPGFNCSCVQHQEVYGDVVDILDQLGDLCPEMRSFYFLYSLAHVPEAAAAVSRTMRTWDHLESIGCRVPDVPSLGHLSEVASLRHLQLHLPYESFRTRLPIHLDQLETLFLSGSPADMTNLLECEDGQLRIWRFESQALYSPDRDDVRKLLSALQERCCHDSLRMLSIQEYHHSLLPPVVRTEFFGITAHMLQPAMSFHELERVYIDTPRAISLDDEDLITLARAWPKAKFVEINPSIGWIAESRVSLKGLVEVLKVLPQLERLAVSVDARVLTPPSSEISEEGQAQPLAGFVHGRLASLDLLDSRVGEEYDQVAAYLFKFVCPPKCRITVWEQPRILSRVVQAAEICQARWQRVFDLLADMH
ncbi:hypothetical protein CONPUDRAFT_142116 [Coniophora puteana RWD-64-598 SS2]|uniref:F-box domain-containing protein n=1 Tax=Coniophora puteana (strain RWD-64-598) TaxID=741705 RepID=A0A5M3N2W5_CONPW|nr:uncharacterized protein CONPUDRAFT_142116 [Coniophora puteana RWD-64-598 SS2]EIW85627.1 hypothetical protein CONPUDRAFT_142116 [Coniophora puteana RWD-64-598 SS2]